MKTVFLLLFLLLTPCLYSQAIYITGIPGDLNCSGSVTVGDLTTLVNYIFSAVPLPNCGTVILEDNYGYNVYDSLSVKKKSYVVINKIKDWTKIKHMPSLCLVLDKTDAVDIFQKIQYYSTNGVITRADTSLTFEFKLSNATDRDSSYFVIERE